jgi:hypothetical protein
LTADSDAWLIGTMKLLSVFFALAMSLPFLAFADDGYSAIRAGGVVFENTDTISMEKEYLEISPTRVRVKFYFRNLKKLPYTAHVAFPLPPLTCGYWGKNSTVSGFKVTVNGKPVNPELEEKAIENKGGGESTIPFGTGKDISAKVKAAGLPLNCFKTWDDKKLFKKAQKAKLAEDYQDKDPEGVLYQTESIYHWEQIFPADSVTVVEHEYEPIAGMGLGYCPYDDKKLPFQLTLTPGKGNCHLVDYILHTAKTWQGPIGHFELSVPVDGYTTGIWSNVGPMKLSDDKKSAVFIKDKFVPEDDLVIGIWNFKN